VDEVIEPTMAAWAVAVGDIDAAVATARAAGYDPGDPASMERTQPDGSTLSWRLTPPLSRAMPFLIEWGSSVHPSTTAAPGLELVELQASHPSPGPFAERLAALGVTMGVLHGSEMLIVELRGPLGTLTFPSVEGILD
jgi:hypothetical protein